MFLRNQSNVDYGKHTSNSFFLNTIQHFNHAELTMWLFESNIIALMMSHARKTFSLPNHDSWALYAVVLGDPVRAWASTTVVVQDKSGLTTCNVMETRCL